MENLYNYKTAALAASFKDADSKKGIVTGYFSAFGNKDSDGDIIVKGAFARSISKHGPDSEQPRIKHLFNHDTTKPLGKLLMLAEDNKGLYYESQVGTHTLGRDFIKMIESGLITEHSIGFRTVKDEIKPDGKYLFELHLWEGSSLSCWGANSETPVTGVKAINPEGHIETLVKQQKAIETFCRNTDASDEAIEALIIYNKQLSQQIINLTTASMNSAPAISSDKDEDKMIDTFKTFYSSLNFPIHGLKRHEKYAGAV